MHLTHGHRKVMAAVLIVGAIPSGLAGTVTNANGLYVIRFFIGILGGTFVPCLVSDGIFPSSDGVPISCLDVH